METLKELILKLNKDNCEEKLNTLECYMERILEWNKSVNLTAVKDREEFIQKHFIDSLLCAGSLEFTEASSICDVGTGGGFPGVPLAVVFPEKDFVLMDSLDKRVRIVRQRCEELGIDNVEVVHGRAEDLARKEEYRDSFDLCVSRAVANMRVLCEYCMPFVKPEGSFIAYKGPGCEEEVRSASKAISILGGKPARIETLEHLGHCLVYVTKITATPKAYPRKAGTPAKKPL